MFVARSVRSDGLSNQLVGAEAAFERLVTLPLFAAMRDADADDVVIALRKVLGHYLR